MKAYLYDVFHRCDSTTGWDLTNGAISLSSTQKVEGKYSLKLTAGVDPPPAVSGMLYTRTVDWSQYHDIIFWVYHPGYTNETGTIKLLTDDDNWKGWDFDFAASWTEIVIDLSSTPDSSAGTLDLSDITKIRIFENNTPDVGEDYYFDFFHSRTIDVSDKIERIRIRDGIFPRKKSATITIHPINESIWKIEDSCKVYDVNDVLCFWGKITHKDRNRIGLYKLKLDSYANEIFRVPHSETYTTNKTSEKLEDMIDDSLYFCYHSSSITANATDYSYVFNRAIAYMFMLGRWMEQEVYYIEPDGKVWGKASGSLTATGKSWNINSTANNITYVSLPNEKNTRESYHKASLGITRTTVLYKDNALSTQPPAATRDPIEQSLGIMPLKEFRDPKIEASTEADQLGLNRYTIFSTETQFIALRIHGEGWLQPGKTIQFQDTGKMAITQAHFLILEFEYDPMHDTYTYLLLSDNIVQLGEFLSFADSSGQQIHTAVTQSIENQATLVEQHNRDIYPYFVVPQDSYTAGDNNVYFTGGVPSFGKDSNTANHLLVVHFSLPPGYVDGENITLVLEWRIGVNDGVNDYDVDAYYTRDVVGHTLFDSEDSTWTGGLSNIPNRQTVTLDGTNLLNGDSIHINIQMEDNANTRVISNDLIKLIVPVNTRT